MPSDVFQIAVFETIFLSLLVIISVLLASNRVRLNWIVAVPLVAFFNKIILFYGAYGKFGDWIGGNYNWEGKIVSTIFTLVLILLLFRRNLKQVGLNLSQSGLALRLGITIAVFTVIATIAWNLFYFPGTKSEPISDILYQAIMPSIEEELWFRGLIYAMLLKGLTTNDSKHPILYYVIISAVVVTIHFWAVHSITTDGNWGFIFRAWHNPVAGIYGVLWMVVRLGTGSIIIPILLHTLANIAGYFV